MSQAKLKNIRPLGSLRGKISNEKNFHIPNWNTKQLDGGVQGSAISIAPQNTSATKDLNESQISCERENKGLVNSKENTASHEKCRDEIEKLLKNEKYLKEQLELLQQQIEEQSKKFQNLEALNESLQTQLSDQEQWFNDELKREKDLHSSTQLALQDMRRELQKTKESLQQMLEDQRLEMSQQITKLQLSLTEKDGIISDKDQKLQKLKTQMADALKGNSWERQQQLEELTKELSRVQNEYELLQMKYKKYKNSTKS